VVDIKELDSAKEAALELRMAFMEKLLDYWGTSLPEYERISNEMEPNWSEFDIDWARSFSKFFGFSIRQEILVIASIRSTLKELIQC
jgi:hypothetical protein